MCVRLFYRSTKFPPQLAEKESDVGVNAGMFLFESWTAPTNPTSERNGGRGCD